MYLSVYLFKTNQLGCKKSHVPRGGGGGLLESGGLILQKPTYKWGPYYYYKWGLIGVYYHHKIHKN